MDKRERIIFELPAAELENIKILLERLISYYYALDQGKLSDGALKGRYDSVMTELFRINDLGVDLGFLMRLDSFATWPPCKDPAGHWPEFITYMQKRNYEIKITGQGTGSGVAACAETN